MGVTPTAGIHTLPELILPIGSQGLPLTLLYADAYDDSPSNITKMPLFDIGLLANPATGSGTVINPSPLVPAAIYDASADILPPSVDDSHTDTPRAAGVTQTISPPSLNHETGALEFGQVVQSLSRSLHDSGEVRSSIPFSRLSLSEAGRYSPQYRRRYSSGRAGNHTWNQTKTTDTSSSPSIDKVWGSMAADGTYDGTLAVWPEGPRIEAITHFTKADLPSNGMGVSWGDAHNATYLTSLCSAPVNRSAEYGGIGTQITPDDTHYSSHWSVNLRVNQPILASGVSISSPDTTPFNLAALGATTADEASESLLHSDETVQTLSVSDKFSDGSAPSTLQAPHTLGRVDLGNHAITDSCGLIGYEGVITATAFFNISKDTDPAQAGGNISLTGKNTYAGLNIQVHSGSSLRRNGKAGAAHIPPIYKYGSDGSSVDAMTDGMKTSAHRSDDFALIEANISQFQTRQSGSINTVTGLVGALARDIDAEHEIVPASDLWSNVAITADRLFGSPTQSGATWAGANTLSSGWLADDIPTKVQIVPQIRGYETVQVTAGGAKSAAYPDAATISFRKPLVDYHILVSVAKGDALVVKANMANSPLGQATDRNDPNPNRLHANMDLSDLPCTIYHGIMRINPTTLEQVYVDAIPSWMDPAAVAMPFTVMPRHNRMSQNTGGAKASMGWGLHQVTPFRPMASRQWPRVPKLCGAIESGGSYQRGGVSHLWDAAAYGDELFLSADMIDATDFAIETTKDGQPYFGVWGAGQIAPNGNPLPQMPQGTELMVFQYSPKRDPWYSSASTSSSNNPVRDALGNNASAVNGLTTYSAQYKAGLSIADERLLADSSWQIHDWVIPQMELMRYLGVENKASVMHPKHSQATGGEIIRHPTAHCSSLRIMDDGKMMMAMIHRDYIETTADYPSADIGYPPNPDAGIGSCPAGFYLSNGQCVPISGTGVPDAGHAFDPLSGDEFPSSGNPSPTAGSSTDGSPPADNFSQYPTWSQMVAATSARSLILAFTDAKAQHGKVARGLGGKAFQVKWSLVPIRDGETQELALQTWSQADTWWSGARIAYWYDESGQRAIPITYGSYPESRLSHASLPKSLPWLDESLKTRDGYPYIQPASEAAHHPSAGGLTDRIPIDPWSNQRLEFLKFTRFTPTTIGFADFGAGANPHQELGWSGWSQPRGLFDPISYGNNTVFFSDSPEATAVANGVAVTPTRQAQWKDFGDVKSYSTTGGRYAPHAAVMFDLSSLTYPCQLIEWIFGGNNMILAPTMVNGISDVLNTILDPALSQWATLYEPTYAPHGGATIIDGNKIVRLYDDAPIIQPPEVFNPITRTLNFSRMRFSVADVMPTTVRSSSGNATMRGPFGGWSHQGPLHYGMSATSHPYRVDRVFKQVHGGVGYDLPLHLLIPANVHVRARAGGRNSIELEMETPFHRTDNLHLIGAASIAANSGFETAPPTVAAGTRPAAGQYYLRTNLWDAPLSSTTGGRTGGYSSNLQRIHGPFVSGTNGLELFWQDHPTDHFHAAAMPILPATDYDLALIETNRYSPLMLSRASEMHELDVLATSEQLLSSVDVHVSQTARPFWDSGAIVSAQGIGQYDAKGQHIEESHAEQSASSTPFTYPLANLSGRYGYGKGQRIVRTPDGTLHQFVIKRSIRASSDNQPQWCHMKKPLHSDVFFSRRSMETNPDTAVGTGKDEVGPLIATLGMGTQSSYGGRARLMGAAFASDSKGTIHAVVEYHVNPNDEATHRAHRLYYTKAECVIVGYNPEPVYDWNWSLHTPVIIQSPLNSATPAAGGTRWDLRMPSLVCDSKDRLHLTVAQPLEAVNSSYSYDQTRILYATKLPEDPSFPDWNPTLTDGKPNDTLWQIVNGEQTASDQNLPAAPPHPTNFNCWPKVTLRSDDTPVVFYWGLASSDFSTSDRRDGAIYTNIGQGGVGGRFSFEQDKCCHVVGLAPDSRNTNTGKPIMYYDAIVDENDKAVVVGIKNDRQTLNGQTWANRQTLMTRFDTRLTLADQYTSTNGLGDTRTLFMNPTYDGVNEMRYVDTYYENPTLTTNGAGEYHLVMGFTMTGSNDNLYGLTFRDAAGVEQSALAPLMWPATPKATIAGVPYRAGYARPTESPDWPEIITPPYPAYANGTTKSMTHLMHIWFPSYEFDDDTTAPDRVIRSINLRWLSVPSMRYDPVKGWVPVGSAQTLAGNEDFPHIASQIRYQRFWGFDSGELDLSWKTNELSWFTTPHAGSKLFYPSNGGVQFSFESSATGEGTQGFPSGV